jgi:hypothetical protein
MNDPMAFARPGLVAAEWPEESNNSASRGLGLMADH